MHKLSCFGGGEKQQFVVVVVVVVVVQIKDHVGFCRRLPSVKRVNIHS